MMMAETMRGSMRHSGALLFAAATLIASCAPVPAANQASDEKASGYVNYPPLKLSVKPALFVANKRGDTLSKIDLETGEEVMRKPACTNPHELATSPDGQHVALACYGGSTVDIFRTSTLERVESFDLSDAETCGGRFPVPCPKTQEARPHGIVWHDNGKLYVTAEGRQSIFAISSPALGPKGFSEFKTGKQGSHMLAVAPDESAAWTTDLGSKTVTRIDLKGSAQPLSVTVGEEPEGISLTPDGKTLWVSARRSDKAYALDPVTMEIRSEVETGRFPLRLLVRPQGDYAITSDLADGSLTVIDTKTSKAVRTIAVSSAQEAENRFQVTILWSDDGNRIYVAETGTDTVAEVDFASGKVLRRLKTGKGGDGLAILP